MAKRKVCKSCKMFVDGPECPACKTSKFSTNWQGRIFINDVKKSAIADRIAADLKGEYALKCR